MPRNLENDLQKRNQQIGRLLMEARTAKEVSVAKCAAIINTSRKRYMDMESGETPIGVAELEKLMRYLGVSARRIWSLRIGLGEVSGDDGSGYIGGIDRERAQAEDDGEDYVARDEMLPRQVKVPLRNQPGQTMLVLPTERPLLLMFEVIDNGGSVTSTSASANVHLPEGATDTSTELIAAS